MAQEQTLDIAKAPQREGDDLSKEELQRRMELARESISETVTEIKENVAQQVETVKDALDWREHFKKQPVAWSLGAMGVGFLAGYGLAAAVKGDRREGDYPYESSFARPFTGERVYSEFEEPTQASAKTALRQENGAKHEGPGLLERFKETSAYDRLSKEAGNIGDRLLDELSTTAQTVVLPLMLTKLKKWVGLDLSEKETGSTTARSNREHERERNQPDRYQPVLD